MSNIRKKIAACLAVLLLFSVTSCENLNKAAQNDGQQIEVTKHIEVESVPEYAGQPYVTIHDNKPDFTEAELAEDVFESYSELDAKGRCGVAEAMIGKELMPNEERGKIGQIKPSGWHTVKYDNVDGKYLYNRCHLIGYQLTAENANEKNLITGTRYMNVDGMLPFENMVADYIKETEHHVRHRFMRGIILLHPAWRWRQSLWKMKEKDFPFMCMCTMYSLGLRLIMQPETAMKQIQNKQIRLQIIR